MSHRARRDLPHNGTWVRSRHKKFSETVVFIHHFGGNRVSVRKHQDFLAELGFDSVAFTLSLPQKPGFLAGTLLNDVNLRLRERWRRETIAVLDVVPGNKILYSFSFPSAVAVVCIAERPTGEIRAWIADGGPFLMPMTCFWNYFTYVEQTPSLWKRGVRVVLGFAALDILTLAADLDRALSALPEGFPVLSIRAWQDKLVPIAAIDQAFAGHSQLQLETLTLPEAEHILGLSQFPEEYKPRVAQFLNRYANRLANEATSVSRD